MLERLKKYDRWPRAARLRRLTPRQKVVATVANVLILIGLYLLLFAGGLKADEQYNVYAARGDTDIVAPTPRIVQPTAASPAQSTTAATAATAAPTDAPSFNIPVLNDNSSGQLTNVVPSQVTNNGPSTVTRIVVPAIKLDRKVVDVGWNLQQQDGQDVAVWDVDKYRVGHHQGTSNPGGGNNIVLAGHSGGPDYPFNDIFYLKAGDKVELYSNGQLYEYTVSDHILVDEVGQPLEKRLANAQYIEPTDEELITMVACWPLTGPNKFNQRIIIRAKPAFATLSADEANREHSDWTAR